MYSSSGGGRCRYETMRPKTHEKRFKFRKRAGQHKCNTCCATEAKIRHGIRPQRASAITKGDYDEAIAITFHGRGSQHPKGGKSDRNSSRTFWHDTYQLCRAWKHANRQ